MTELPLGLEPAERVLIEGALAEYKQGLDFIHSCLVELNVNVFIVEHILKFPLDLFFGNDPNNNIFFGQVVNNALYMSVLSITKLIHDSNSDFFTLEQFRNKGYTLLKPEYKKAFATRLNETKVRSEKETSKLLEKMVNLRHNQIAHFKRSFVNESLDQTRVYESFDQIIEQARLLFSEVQVLCDKLTKSYMALFFDTWYGWLPIPYDDWEYGPDIFDILDRIARTSDILNMPESNPVSWQQIKATLTEKQLRQLNHYRKKFKLEEI